MCTVCGLGIKVNSAAHANPELVTSKSALAVRRDAQRAG
jgi:hypothetical protein